MASITVPRFRTPTTSNRQASIALARFAPLLPRRTRRASRQTAVVLASKWGTDYRELLIGDVLCLVSFCIYKQIVAIILSPSFAGWLAPLSFNVTRLEELAGFIITVTGTWVATSYVTGDYASASPDVQHALLRTSRTWLLSMPVMAAQLVLATAAESGSLVGVEGFASSLPLAASGVGEPFVSAAGILGVTAVWRTYYAAFLDWNTFLSIDYNGPKQQRQARAFVEALMWVGAIAVLGCCLQLAAGAMLEQRP